MKTYVLKEKTEPASNEIVWAFDLGKGSIGEAVRRGNEFLHKASLLIPAEFAETKTAAGRRRMMRTRDAHKEREIWLENPLTSGQSNEVLEGSPPQGRGRPVGVPTHAARSPLACPVGIRGPRRGPRGPRGATCPGESSLRDVSTALARARSTRAKKAVAVSPGARSAW